MTMETALRKRLLDDAAVKAIVSTRVDWGIRPEGDPYPSIVLTLVSDPRPQHLTDFQPLRDTRVQIDCYAENYGQAVALREAVIPAIVPRKIMNGVRFDRSRINNIVQRSEPAGQGKIIHRQLIDASIWHGTTE